MFPGSSEPVSVPLARLIGSGHQARRAGDMFGTGKPFDLGEHRSHGQSDNPPHTRNGLQALEVDARPDLTAALAGLKDLEHRRVNGSRRLAGQLRQFVSGVGGRVVQRQEQGGAMADGAGGDGLAQLDDPLLRRPRVKLVQRVERLLGHPVEVVLVAAHQLDDDRFLGVEVVIEAARQDSRGVGDLLERGPQAGRGKHGRRRLEHLFSACSLAHHRCRR